MSVILQTVINDQTHPSVEHESIVYSRIAFIDPDKIISSPDENFFLFNDPSLLKPEVLQLYDNLEKIIELMQKSTGFSNITGPNQILIVEDLEHALKETPQHPFCIDTFNNNAFGPSEHLMSFYFEEKSETYPFIRIGLSFFNNLKPLPLDNGSFLLLNTFQNNTGVIPTFYPQSNLPQNIGRIDVEGQRVGMGPINGLLKISPAKESQISSDALMFIDQYCKEALKDPHTLG